MFVTRSKLDRILKQRDNDIKSLTNRYWEIVVKHRLLLSYLDLTEVDVPAKVELRKKGGPEKPDGSSV